ncbi:MAG TPA: MtnX-like HAD-IB family phosphatase [Candidatus Kapabacteria bacterium]|nr:MtnX-like HAD-IB family phosphatase [Candidatus Kapabacteria bacterium]
MYHVYCDFDATVTVNDVWDILFKHFGDPKAFTVWQKFNTREYTAAECIAEACATVRNVDPRRMSEVFTLQEIRSGFSEFAEFCEEKNIALTIVSDGFSLYIRPILEHNSLNISFHANTIELTNDGSLSVEFTNGRESCWRCGSCKCSAITTTSADEDTIVYIGDGYSDHCPVEISDVIFARDMLRSFCSTHGIPYHPFEDFHTVKEILQIYLTERPKYKRLEASKNRKKLYVIE